MSTYRYRVVVEGELGPRFASAFDGMTLFAHDGRTDIIGAIVDPSCLHGLLERIAGLGLTVHSLNPLDTEDAQPDAPPPPPPAGLSYDPGATSKGPR
jgi:hypothetical protein